MFLAKLKTPMLRLPRLPRGADGKVVATLAKANFAWLDQAALSSGNFAHETSAESQRFPMAEVE